MVLRKWEQLPEFMKVPQVREYYDSLRKKRAQLVLKRFFDIVASGIMLVVLSPAFLVIGILIKLDSSGPVFFRQERVTQYGKSFRIYKFRTMISHSDSNSQITVSGDTRITRAGKILRKLKLDELGQLIDVFRGTMTFVGVRPEVPRYVDAYTPEMLATLLLPAGITSRASIYYKNENELISGVENVADFYVNEILPLKMKINLEDIKSFNLLGDLKIILMTVLGVLGKDYPIPEGNVMESRK